MDDPARPPGSPVAPEALAARRWVLEVEREQSFADLPEVGDFLHRHAETLRRRAADAERRAEELVILGPAATEFLSGPDRDAPGAFFAVGEGQALRYENEPWMTCLAGYRDDEQTGLPSVSVWTDERGALGEGVGGAAGSLAGLLATYPSWTSLGASTSEISESSPGGVGELIARMATAERADARAWSDEAAEAEARAEAVAWRRLNPGRHDLPSPSADDVARRRVRQMAMALLEAAEGDELPDFNGQDEQLKTWCGEVIRKSPSTAWKALTDTNTFRPGPQGKTGHALYERLDALLDVLRRESPELKSRVENVENRVLDPLRDAR